MQITNKDYSSTSPCIQNRAMEESSSPMAPVAVNVNSVYMNKREYACLLPCVFTPENSTFAKEISNNSEDQGEMSPPPKKLVGSLASKEGLGTMGRYNGKAGPPPKQLVQSLSLSWSIRCYEVLWCIYWGPIQPAALLVGTPSTFSEILLLQNYSGCLKQHHFSLYENEPDTNMLDGQVDNALSFSVCSMLHVPSDRIWWHRIFCTQKTHNCRPI